MKKLLLFSFMLVLVGPVWGQQKLRHKKSFGRTHFEGGVTLSSNGNNHIISPSALQYWALGKNKQKFKFGIGARYSASLGNNKLEYITARADLTSGKVGPSVFFADQIPENIDTLSLSATRIHAMNLLLALRYDLDKKFAVEFNIDLAGFSFGKRKEATLTYDDGETYNTNAYPTSGNLLLISDNDIGSLNSELMLSYLHKKHMRFKAGAVFMFNEYDVVAPVRYNNSAGKLIDASRYRNKTFQFGLGFNYVFNYFLAKPYKR